MEQLIFIGIILLFSMLEAVARKKRETGEGPAPLPAPPPREPELRLPRASERAIPSYDEDPSFDDAVDAGSRGVPGHAPGVARGAGGKAGRPSTEGLIPVDVWEEIQALARGGQAPRPVSQAPEPAPPGPPKPVTAPARAPRAAAPPMSTAPRMGRTPAVAEVEVAGVAEHAVHLTHPKYGKPVQDRLTPFGGDARPRRLPEEADAVRTVLRGGRVGLRQAILLQEILGPPVSLKDDPSAG